MSTDKPTPMELLSQLAEDVVRQIDAHSESRFQSALNQLTDYHRFLLEAYSTSLPDGRGESYARLSSGWRATYQDWLSVYFGIIDRAIEELDRDPNFVQSLAYLPMNLLPRGLEYGAAQATNDILDLESALIFRLERRLASKSTMPQEEIRAASVDRGAVVSSPYEEVLKSIVSAWERTQSIGPGRRLYEPIEDPAHRWQSMKKSWSYYFRHLQVTAVMLVAATWYGDKTGASRFRELLLRWRYNAQPEGSSAYLLDWTPFLNADLLNLDWSEVTRRLQNVRFIPQNPDVVFDLILDTTHRNAIELVAAIFIQWNLVGKVGDFAVVSARHLLSGEDLDADAVPRTENRHINERCLDIFELCVTGPCLETESSYGALLDSLVSVLDRVSERPVQSGRVYTPSTAHDRDALTGAFVVMLIASLDEQSRLQTMGDQLRAFIGNEDALPQGDRTLMSLISFVEVVKGMIAQPAERLLEAAKRLAPGLTTNEAIGRLKGFLEEIRVEVDRVRNERTRKRKIDPKKIERMQKAVEKQLLEGNGRVRYFRGFSIERLRKKEIAPAQMHFNDIEKNEFVSPSMGAISSNYFEVVSAGIAQHIADRVLVDFLQKPKIRRPVRTHAGTAEFWHSIKGLAAEIGSTPYLTLPDREIQAFAREFLYGIKPDQGLQIERQPPNNNRPRHQRIAIVEGIEVYHLNAQGAGSLMFDGNILEKVEYAALEDDSLIKIAFEDVEGNPWKGRLSIIWAQRAHWRDSAIVELVFDTDDGEEQA